MTSYAAGPSTSAIKQEQDVLLEVKHLNVYYQSGNVPVHAVNDVSFTLHRGQILGLAGESGSGKSTLAYAITRLLRPPALVSGGEIWYYPRRDRMFVQALDTDQQDLLSASKQQVGENDEPVMVNVLDLSPSQLRAFRWQELAIVFQSAMNALNPVLRLVGISPDRLRSYPHELSGGMRQRAIIAIALALNPDIIIMDEPTTALDVVVQREILAEISALRREFGFSVIFITHDLSLLLEIGDHIAIMYAGRIVETATREQLYRRPRHPYTDGLLHSFPTLHGPRRTMLGIPGSPPICGRCRRAVPF